MSAIGASTTRVPLALFGLPSIGSIVEGIVNFFFSDLARALVPGFLKNASVATIKWLVAVPDPSAWTHVSQLETDMSYLAVSLLGVSFTAAIVRYLLVGLTGSGHPLQALSSTLASAGLLVGYPWASHQVVAIVNTLTNSILSFPIVGAGLQRTVGVMFGSALLVGSGGVFLALLVIVGVVFAAIMFALKVLILLAFALLYVTGPLVIAVRPLPELAHLSRAWATALLGLALVPVGWTILFAVAGALSLDATSFGSTGSAGLGGGLTAHIAGAFAALLTFYLALKLPLGVLSHLRGSLPGFASGAGSRGGAGTGSVGGGLQRVSDAHARLRSNTLTAGRAAGLAAGVLGAPAGGALGAAGRSLSRRSAPLGASALAAGGAIDGAALASGGRLGRSFGALRGRRSGDAGESVDGTPSRGRATRERLSLARQTFTQVFAIHRAGESVRAGAKRGATPTRFGTGASGGRRPANLGRSAPVQPPRPPQRGARAGEGDTRASSATGRGGSSDGTAPSRRSGNGQAGKPASPGKSAPLPSASGSARRDDALAADSRARRQGSRPTTRKPPPVASPERERPQPKPSKKAPAPRRGSKGGSPRAPRRTAAEDSAPTPISRAGWLARLRLRRD